ncbi:MAG: SDR family NAD(P)-dependent oxidoreductase [Dehalococcoidia bacterium]|nr:SDR family NAD(P)-dependent oxidoreductase [Dehalococcoidia bacterium]
MDLGIKGRNALITGGSRGLGRQSAISLAREGANVAICARGQERLDETAAELRNHGGSVVAINADMSLPEAAASVFAEAESALGSVDILINNVGGSLGTSTVLATSEEDFQAVFDVNLWSSVRLMQLAAPGMRDRKWGRIVNIASIWGREYGGSAPYMASKASLIAVTKHLAIQLAPDGICVNSVAPGSIEFPGGGWERFRNSNTPEDVAEFLKWNLPAGKFGYPEPIGDTVAFLSSENAGWIMGACINVDGGQSKNLF